MRFCDNFGSELEKKKPGMAKNRQTKNSQFPTLSNSFLGPYWAWIVTYINRELCYKARTRVLTRRLWISLILIEVWGILSIPIIWWIWCTSFCKTLLKLFNKKVMISSAWHMQEKSNSWCTKRDVNDFLFIFTHFLIKRAKKLWLVLLKMNIQGL